MHGHGILNWWGFSPPIDLLNYMDDEGGKEATVQVVVAGAGDPRHLLVTLARRHRRRLRVYLLEAHVEVYARVLLLMGISLQQDLGLRERASLLLDLWGNLYLRPTSRDYLELSARKLSLAITDAAQYPALLGLISAGRLKYRERDDIDSVCRTWYKLSPNQYDPALCWDVRLRQMLRARYDNRRADAEWAWHMRLAHRIQHLHVGPPGKETDGGLAAGKGGPLGDGHAGVGSGWGQEYLVWRGTGQAFTVATDAASHLPNTSLASVATLTEGTTRHRRLGYWGDVLTGPFPALALASADARVSKTSNGGSTHSGSEVAQWNLENLLRELWAHHHHLEEEQQLIGGKVERLVEGQVEETVDKKVGEKLVQAQRGLDDKNLVEKQTERKMEMHVERQVERKTEEEVKKQVEGKMKKQMEEVKKKPRVHEEQQMNVEQTHTEVKTGKQEVAVKQQVNREIGREETSVVQRCGADSEKKEVPEAEIEEGKIETKTKCEEDNNGDKFINSDKCESRNKGVKDKNCELLASKTKTNMNTVCEGATNEAVSTVSNGVEKQSDSQYFVPVSTGTQTQSEIDTQNSISNMTDNASSQWPGSRREAGERVASGDWLRLDGVEVVLVSPSHLSDLTTLPEVEGGLDLVYLSAAMAHLLTPTLLHTHLRPHTRLILETAQMFPELTDAQLREYETRVTSSAGEAGWVRAGPDPLCHLLFYRR